VTRRLIAAVAAAGLAAGCGDVNAALGRLAEARRLDADLLVAFTKASNATDRAVMADTDAASDAFAQEAGGARQALHQDVASLRPLLAGLGYTDEIRILDQFEERLTAYEALDRQILDLAVENTNLKAQRLSFGEAQMAADAFQQAMESMKAASERDRWHVTANVASAVGAVRAIQVLQAPHIAALEDASMTRIEARMKAEETAARGALAGLASMVDSASRATLPGATAALDRFMDVNAQIVGLSRQNSNVRSLALALNEKQKLVAPCEESLRALGDALAHRGYPKGRWE
jgi:hypothetical protein